MRRRERVGGAVFLVMALVASVVFAQPSSAQKVFRVGFLGPLTGPVARTGDEFKSAVALALDGAG